MRAPSITDFLTLRKGSIEPSLTSEARLTHTSCKGFSFGVVALAVF